MLLYTRSSLRRLIGCLMLLSGFFFYTNYYQISSTIKSRKLTRGFGYCPKVKKIAFLKVHKAGSTSVSNILQRFALHNDLNLLLPDKNQTSKRFMFHVIGRDYSQTIPAPRGQHYDILCNHVVYNREQFKNWFDPDTKYIAIVRDPVDRFLSAAYYYGVLSKNKVNEHGIETESLQLENYLLERARNGSNTADPLNQAVDFGVHPRNQTKSFMSNYLDIIKDDFSLVLIMEYFDESLVLMRRLFCWELQDIIYLKLNINKRHSSLTLTEDSIKLLKYLQSAEQMIYELFLDRFWQQMLHEGPGVFDEVQHFKNVLSRISRYCYLGVFSSDLVVETSEWNNIFSISADDCRMMMSPEIAMNKELIARQWQKYYKSLKKKI